MARDEKVLAGNGERRGENVYYATRESTRCARGPRFINHNAFDPPPTGMNTATPQGETPKSAPSVPAAGNREVEVGIPGRALTGDMKPADTRDNMVSLADWRPATDAMSVYTLQRALVKSRITVRAVLRHATASPHGDSDAIWRSVSLTARLSRLQADVDRLLIATAQMIWRLEDATCPPTVAERRQIAVAVDESRSVITELNLLTQHDLASHYLQSVPGGVPYIEPIVAP